MLRHTAFAAVAFSLAATGLPARAQTPSTPQVNTVYTFKVGDTPQNMAFDPGNQNGLSVFAAPPKNTNYLFVEDDFSKASAGANLTQTGIYGYLPGIQYFSQLNPVKFPDGSIWLASCNPQNGGTDTIDYVAPPSKANPYSFVQITAEAQNNTSRSDMPVCDFSNLLFSLNPNLGGKVFATYNLAYPDASAAYQTPYQLFDIEAKNISKLNAVKVLYTDHANLNEPFSDAFYTFGVDKQANVYATGYDIASGNSGLLAFEPSGNGGGAYKPHMIFPDTAANINKPVGNSLASAFLLNDGNIIFDTLAGSTYGKGAISELKAKPFGKQLVTLCANTGPGRIDGQGSVVAVSPNGRFILTGNDIYLNTSGDYTTSYTVFDTAKGICGATTVTDLPLTAISPVTYVQQAIVNDKGVTVFLLPQYTTYDKNENGTPHPAKIRSVVAAPAPGG